MLYSDYYTYCLIDPRSLQPFYVGKGRNRRMYQHALNAFNSRYSPNNLVHCRIHEIHGCNMKVLYEKMLVNATATQALNKEMQLIESYGRVDLGTGCLLNQTSGGGGASELSAQARKLKKQMSSKPVSQYTLDGKWVADFVSAKDASETVSDANRSYITQVCKGKRKSAGGFLWVYKDAPVPTFTKKYHRAVRQYDTNGTLIKEYRSLTEAQNRTGVELHNISECCRGKSKTAGSYLWKYVR